MEQPTARLDPLTGVEDRGALNDFVELIASSVAERPIVAVMFDVDHFKRINDSLGHPVGDAVLKSVGETVHRLVDRYKHGRTFRYGGDEFVVILDGHTVDEASALARTILHDVRDLSVPHVSEPLTLSIGISDSPPSSLAEMIARADQALLQAKNAGRNRVELFVASAKRPSDLTRRLILNPYLFAVRDKTLRLAFIRTAQYQQAVDFVSNHDELPLKCVSVLGRTDLLVAHLGDRDHRFHADIQPLLIADADGADARALPYFEVGEILKFHGQRVTPRKTPRNPEREILARLVDAAEGIGVESITDGDFDDWYQRGYALGFEGIQLRPSEIEAYVTVDILGGRKDDVAPELFRVVVEEDLLPEAMVLSIYEGHGVNANMQYMIRTRSTPSELFDFLEFLHRKCHRLTMPRIHTSTFMVVRYKALRLYRSLLMPPLSPDQKRVRDIIIMPELTPEEQSQFLFFRPDVQTTLIDQVGRLDEAFNILDVPAEYLLPKHVAGLRKTAIRAVVTGDVVQIRHVYADLISTLEPALRRLAVSAVRRHFPDLAAAVKEKIVSQAAANRDLQGMTLGEVRDILRQFHRSEHPAADRFPPLRELERLQQVIDIRNKLTHGEAVKPEDATRILADFVQFLNAHSAALFFTEPSL
jgi:diguanylate cyclase (GGDEF)-like protein